MSAKRLLLIPVLGYVVWLVLAYDYHFIDGVNLLFHEAGHVFLGFFGQTLQVLGGTLGQLFFPIACGVHFLQRQQRFEGWLMGIWLAESLMYTARYLGDARDQVLPLVGGHVHDWGFLLGRWGMDRAVRADRGGAPRAGLGPRGCLLGRRLAIRQHRLTGVTAEPLHRPGARPASRPRSIFHLDVGPSLHILWKGGPRFAA